MLQRCDLIDMNSLLRWLAQCQMSVEGGFQGRTNKLVDACYSFWQGAAPALLVIASAGLMRAGEGEDGAHADAAASVDNCPGSLLFDQLRLQEYLMVCAQDLNGGFRDKPGKHRDFYHTCYSLSGLSVAQNFGQPVVFGDSGARLASTNPIYNLRSDLYQQAQQYFAKLPCDHHLFMSQQPASTATATATATATTVRI